MHRGTCVPAAGCGCLICSTSPGTHAASGSNTSQKSWLQFANIGVGACGFLQIDVMSDKSLELSMIDAADTSGRLMTNTAATGVTGPATATIPIS